MKEFRLQLLDIELVLSRNKLVVPVPWGHFTAFFEERSKGKYTPHFTFLGRRLPIYFPMRASRIEEVCGRFQRRLLERWRAVAEEVTLENLAADGWFGIEVPDAVFEVIFSRALRNGAIQITEETFAVAPEWLLDHAVLLEELPHDGRPKSMWRETPDGLPEFRQLFPMPHGKWVTLPGDWLPDEVFVQIMREEVPPAFWKRVRRLLQVFRVKDLSRVDQFMTATPSS